MSVEELFGTLQQSVVASWRKHLKTDKYSKHEALDEFYKEMPELVDKLIEDWMGVNGKVEEYKNLLDNSAEMTAIEYLQQLKKIVKDGYELMEEKELEADLDSIASQIDSTLYKLKELDEHKTMKSLKNYISETMVTEAKASFEVTYDLNRDVYSALSELGFMYESKNKSRLFEQDKMEKVFKWFLDKFYEENGNDVDESLNKGENQ